MAFDSTARPPVVQTFGWQPGAWASLLVSGAGYIFVQPSPEAYRTSNAAFCVSLVVAGLLLAAYELWRRRSRIALVTTADSVEVYRRGNLDVRVAAGDIVTYLRHPANTAGVLFSLSLFCVLLVVIAVFLPGDLSAIERVLMFAGGLSVAAMVGSLVWTRLFCEQLIVPSGGRLGHAVLVRRTEYRRMLR